MKIPEIEVGILSEAQIRFSLNGSYMLKSTGQVLEGEGFAQYLPGGEILLTVGKTEINAIQPLLLEPAAESSSFDLLDVVIGIQFHWERKERQRFKGALKILSHDHRLIAVNKLTIEDYLVSVISSEMNAGASPEFLKAHAVISRSWLLAQFDKKRLKEKDARSIIEGKDEYIRWYDREDHELFDVCADDHCQRYQGITKVTTSIAEKAVTDTRGEVMHYGGQICDTRFSKCCGGISEDYVNAWDPEPHPYLTKVVDNPSAPSGFKLDLTIEANAEKWILGSPAAFCNTKDERALNAILNDYDRETQHFYRWEVTLSQKKLQQLLLVNTGHDFGEIIDLLPVQRGLSGRLIRLKIVGTKKVMTIGKELYIRKALSDSHLYSSAFVVQKEYEKTDVPATFILRGAGWGHGVGLCQIGAAVMGEKGYSYQDILMHYFPGAALKNIYQ